MSEGFLLVISGPSGVGKGTVLSLIHENVEGVYYSVSATTRPKRPHEIEGKNYFFVTRERFEAMIAADELVEYTEYCGNYYGTPVGPVLQMLEEGRAVVLEIETDGAWQIKKKYPDAVLVFVTASNFEELRRRLRKRATESEEQIQTRLERAREEYGLAGSFDYIIVNDRVERAVAELASVIRAERCRAKRRLNVIEEEMQL